MLSPDLESLACSANPGRFAISVSRLLNLLLREAIVAIHWATASHVVRLHANFRLFLFVFCTGSRFVRRRPRQSSLNTRSAEDDWEHFQIDSRSSSLRSKRTWAGSVWDTLAFGRRPREISIPHDLVGGLIGLAPSRVAPDWSIVIKRCFP